MRDSIIKKKIDNVYLLYSVFFLVSFLCVFSPFLYYGKSFVWNMDGLTQHYTYLLYFRQWVSEIIRNITTKGLFEIPMWDMSLGLGQDFLNSVTFRPLNWISIFWNRENLEYFFIFKTFVSLYLAGIGFIVFCKKNKCETFSTIFGSLIYVFCTYSLIYSVRHNYFTELMIFLPFLLASAKTLMENGKSKMFVVIVGLCGLSYFYFLYIITIPTVVYVICLYVEKKDKSVTNLIQIFLRFFGHYLLGLGIAAISFIPNIMIVYTSGRSSSAVSASDLFYDWKYYLHLLTAEIDITQLSSYGFIGVSGLSVIAVISLFLNRDIENRKIKYQIVFFLLCFIFPFMSLVFNGFGGMTERWSYIYVFWIAYATAKELPNLLHYDKDKTKKIIFGVTIYSLGYILIKAILVEKIEFSICFLFVYVLGFILYELGRNDKVKIINKKGVCLVLFIVFCIETTFKSFTLYGITGENYIADFLDQGIVLNEKNNTSAEALQLVGDNTLNRADVIVPQNEKYKYRNYGVGIGINGISSYFSYMSEYIKTYMLETGNTSMYMPFMIYDLNQRTGLNALASVKYATNTESNKNRLPYGYELIASKDKIYTNGSLGSIYVYNNLLSVPIMYSYDTYLTYDNFNGLETNEKEQAMLQSCILEKSEFPEMSPTFNYITLLNMEEIEKQINEGILSGSTNVEYSNGLLKIKEDNIGIKLNIPSGYVGEIYVRIDNILYEYVDYSFVPKTTLYETRKKQYQDKVSPEISETIVSTMMGGFGDKCNLFTKLHQYYLGERDVLQNLGYCTTGNELWIYFSKQGDYTFSDIEVICQPMDQYETYISKLRSANISNIAIDGNLIKGSIESETDKIICLTIPYSTGWRAFIDGKEVDIKRANIMYMAIEVSAGKHDIVFKYETPGLKIGALITFISMIIFFTFFVSSSIKCKKSKTRLTKEVDLEK